MNRHSKRTGRNKERQTVNLTDSTYGTLPHTPLRPSLAERGGVPGRSEPSTAPLKIFQLNMQGARCVSAQLSDLLHRGGVDLALVQEPYSSANGCLAGLGASVRRVTAQNCRDPRAAVLAYHGRTTVTQLDHLSSRHAVCVEVHNPVVSFYAVSAYFQYSEPTSGHLGNLSRVLRALQGRRVLICADVNAKSVLWGSPATDGRGELVEDFVASHGLHLLNSGCGATFCGARGSSSIDITLVTGSMLPFVVGWTVRADATTSDHQLIEVLLNSSDPVVDQSTPERPARFNTAKVRREAFLGVLSEELRRLSGPSLHDRREVEEFAVGITSALTRACEVSMPRRAWRGRAHPWWTAELSCLKREVLRARRRFQAEQQPERKDQKRLAYHRLKNAFRRKVLETSRDSWRKFVTEKGNKDPWGIVYRLQTGRLRTKTVLCAVRDEQGVPVNSAREGAELFLRAFVPDCAAEADLPDADDVGDPADDEQAFTMREAWNVVRVLPNNKAPGPDYIEVQTIKMAWPLMGGPFLCLVNACLRLGVFPDIWKEGDLCIILKDPDRDRACVRSYRPVCLLSALGKVFERLLLVRLRRTVLSPGRISGQQFGFTKNRSTEDALCDVRRILRGRDERLVLSVLFDITGAFDNVRWPLVLRGLRSRGCPQNVLGVLGDYFNNRRMRLSWGAGSITKQATMGCPQGSVLGPCAWNIVFDGLLRELEGLLGSDFVAYADDLQVIVAAESRRSLESKAQAVVDTVARWCARAGLTISKTKTEMVFLRCHQSAKQKTRARKVGSKRNRERAYPSDWDVRAPTVRLDGASIPLRKSVRSLGVILDHNLRVTTHCERTADRIKKLVATIRRVAPARWGLDYRTMKLIYGGLVKPIAGYAAAAWSDLMTETNRRRLESAQRMALLAMTRAYRTAPTSALCVLAGEAPICLFLAERVAKYRLRRAQRVAIGGLIIEPEDIDDRAARKIEQETVRLWQEEWTSAADGRRTYRFFPDIRGRLMSTWISPGYHVSQFLTGHGSFAANLWRFGCADRPGCDCGGPEESMEHVLTECPTHQELRERVLPALAAGERWPDCARDLVSRRGFAALRAFALGVALKRDNAARVGRTAQPDR